MAKSNPPIENKLPKVSKPKKFAGGLSAVTSSLKHTQNQMGLGRGVQVLSQLNQKDGFDCPGCAWPDPDEKRSWFEFCENGVKAVAEEATTNKIDKAFFKKYSTQSLSEKSDYWLSQQGRLTEPMVLIGGYYHPISWDEAFKMIANELNQLSSPNEAIFYTSGRTSNEAAFLYQLFVRLFGTNNLPDCSNMCHESSGVGLSEVIGIGKGTVTLDDFGSTDCIIVSGQNPGTNHPRMLSHLQAAAKRGCQIISINPLPEAGLLRFQHPQKPMDFLSGGTPLTTLFLQVKLNGDVALTKGILKYLLEQEQNNPNSILDHTFIQSKTIGFEQFKKDIEQESWQLIEKESGIALSKIKQAASIIGKSKRMIVCWAMGLTQHKNAVANIQELVNLLLLGGHFGRKGAGACPVRGHSNVQGDRTMGIWERPTESFLNSIEKVFNFNPPRKHGFDTVAAIQAMKSKQAKVFFAMGGNFLSATPDTNYTASALENCELTVQISTKLNRSHLITGKKALILPCLGRTEKDVQSTGEQFVSVENSMGIVHKSRGKLKPTSENLLSEVAIVCNLATETFKNTQKEKTVEWDALKSNYDLIRNKISETISGFDNYNEKIKQSSGFYLPNAVRDHCEFKTEHQKALFSVHNIPKSALSDDQFLMMTIRSHDQYNTTIYGLDDRYRGIKNGRRVLFMNPDDIKMKQFRAGQKVDITSHFNGNKRMAESFSIVAYPIPIQSVAAYFPEANVLVPVDSFADKSRTPTSKSFTVTIDKRSDDV